jgi:hypothetical protein
VHDVPVCAPLTSLASLAVISRALARAIVLPACSALFGSAFMLRDIVVLLVSFVRVFPMRHLLIRRLLSLMRISEQVWLTPLQNRWDDLFLHDENYPRIQFL